MISGQSPPPKKSKQDKQTTNKHSSRMWTDRGGVVRVYHTLLGYPTSENPTPLIPYPQKGHGTRDTLPPERT